MAWVKDKSKNTFSLDKVDGTVKIVEISTFSTIQVYRIMKVKGHEKRVTLKVEPQSNVYNPSVVAIPSYANLRSGSSKVSMSLRNLTCRNVSVKVKLIVAQVATDNVIPPMLTPKNSQESEK